jgi:pimeloyl-ACP methyl ester carboxylesterase
MHLLFGVDTPLLARENYRVIVPHLRGYGTTTFLSADAVRNGEQVAFVKFATQSIK